jgi:formylglycine-generating enzyme required for sulfatase activity
MPDRLPPDLTTDIADFLMPLLNNQGEREALVAASLKDWERVNHIDLSGSAYVFTHKLIRLLPGEQLTSFIRAPIVGEKFRQQVSELCRRVEAALALNEKDLTESLDRFNRQAIEILTQPRYQIDSRFVKLTLLLDKGANAEGVRFVQDEKRGEYDSLLTLLSDVDDHFLVLLGSPGSGKTTLLRRLQLRNAWIDLEGQGGQVTFFASLNRYRRQGQDRVLPDPWDWLAEEWRGQDENLPDFKALFAQGRLVLLLDGLNEMPHRDKDDYRERITRWRRFLQDTEHHGNTMVFSCRNLDYSAPLGSGSAAVRQIRVEPLADEQIQTFLRLYLDDQGDAVWQTLHQDRQQVDLFSNPFFLSLLVEQVGESGTIPAGQAELLTGFVRRTLKREMIDRESPLLEPGLFLSEDDCQQLLQGVWASLHDLPWEGGLIGHLEKLAFDMQAGRQSEEAAQVRILEKDAESRIEHERARDLIRAGVQLNVLDKDMATREIYFYHQLIQEYFAARVLAVEPDPGRVAVPWEADQIQPSLAETLEGLEVSDPLPGAPTTGWEETTVLAAAMARDQTGFVSDLMEANLPLAARCAASPEVSLSPQVLGEIRKALLDRIRDPQADLRARIAAAESLGDLGNPHFIRRMGPHGAYLEPPVVKIPGGEYPIGSDDSQFDDEKPAHSVELEPFEIGVFPVTNAEYRLFTDAGGYVDERWWETEAAKAWLRGEGAAESRRQAVREYRDYLKDFSDGFLKNQTLAPDQIEYELWLKHVSDEELERVLEDKLPSDEIYNRPQYWEDSRLNHASRPVVGLSWFEARAYCAWLSVQTGQVYELPTEAEWEAAAGGAEGRDYAYEGDFDPAKCNTFETHIRGTAPVGVFPQGRTPEGVHDLSGNVWEWTTTIWGRDFQSPEYGYPYDGGDGREDPEDGGSRRAVRGGSWHDLQADARAASRGRYHPTARNYSVGFRIVRRPPSQDH